MLILFSIAGCENPYLKFTKVTICIAGDSGYICHDPKNDRDFTVTYEDGINNICTTPREFEKLKKGVIDLAKKYELCLADLDDDWKNDSYYKKLSSNLDYMSVEDSSAYENIQK